MGWKKTHKNILPWQKMPRNGMFQNVWENKSSRGPQPGAQAYAFESYGLVEFSPIGPTHPIDEQIRSINPQLYVGLAVPVGGIPLQAGGFQLQSLIDPQTPGGYSSLPTFQAVPVPNQPHPSTAPT